MANNILIRDVIEEDLQIFFEQERDPVANLMAAFPARDEESFASHWRNKILVDNADMVKTIIFNGSVAGSVDCWKNNGQWLIGYWIGREYWGKGIATAALKEFLTHVKVRPLHAFVAKHNKGSIRVLEKCGFTISGHGTIYSEVHGHNIEETILICEVV